MKSTAVWRFTRAEETVESEDVPDPLPIGVFYDRDGQIDYTLSPYLQTVINPDERQVEVLEAYISERDDLERAGNSSNDFAVRHIGTQSENVDVWLEVFEFLKDEVLDVEDGQITYGVIQYAGKQDKIAWDTLLD